jgi:predicted dehydrogenase/predicted transcriptional regulator
MKTPVGVAVIGAGYWGRKLVYEYLSAECKGNVKLAGVCDPSPSALAFCREKFSVKDELLTERVEDLIGDSKVTGVHIACPNHTHYAIARMALEAGKDVLVEKPMTLSSREAYELVDLAVSQGVILQVGHIFRFNSALRKAREILDEGAIGKIFYGRIQWTDSQHFADRDIIFDLGPHPVDVLNQLFKSWPIQVSGFARAYRNSKNHEEIAYGIAEFGDGVFAHVELSWLHPGKIREATIVGSKATIVVDCLKQHIALHNSSGVTEVPVSVNNTIEAEINWFTDCISRRCVDVESGLIGARTIEVLEAMRKSMWERPLPILQPVEHDHTAVLISILQSIGEGADQLALMKSPNVHNAKSEKYLEMMSRLRLVKTTVTSNGLRYEATEDGLRFLKEYGDIEGNIRKTPRPDEKVLSNSK